MPHNLDKIRSSPANPIVSSTFLKLRELEEALRESNQTSRKVTLELEYPSTVSIAIAEEQTIAAELDKPAPALPSTPIRTHDHSLSTT